MTERSTSVEGDYCNLIHCVWPVIPVVFATMVTVDCPPQDVDYHGLWHHEKLDSVHLVC